MSIAASEMVKEVDRKNEKAAGNNKIRFFFLVITPYKNHYTPSNKEGCVYLKVKKM